MTTNLSGSLSEFSLAEVLSLLGMGGRTARMQVTSSAAMGTVHLVEGRISSATADSTRASLLRAVVAALPVPADDLAQALHSEDPVRELVESGVVDRDAAQQVAAEHCTEAVGEMLGWAAGEFAVWVGPQDPTDIGVRLDVDGLVGAARERAKEWHDLRAALPQSDSVLALVPDVAQAPVLDRDDWAVLARVDGRRTLAEVLAAMAASPLVAGDRLVQLLSRGLVAVQVGGGDAELERANQMLDAFESGGPAAGVIELAVAPEPDFVSDVHDLFVTEPEAVAEWQVAGAEPWVVAEPEPVHMAESAAGVDVDSGPVPAQDHVPAGDFVAAEEHALASDWAALLAPEFPAGPEPVLSQTFPAGEAAPYELEPVELASDVVTFASEQVEFASESVGFAAEPVEVATEPVGFATEPVGFDAVTPPFEVAPAAEPVAESFAWSPWAQEMGLGEAPAVAVAAPEPSLGGFADMVEDGGGHGHTDAFPVPQAPGSGGVDVGSTVAEHGAFEVAGQFVPQPRDPGDGVVDPSTYAQSGGAHAATAQPVPAPGVAAGTATVEPPAETLADPLAGGLLAHLMSSVRGL